MTNFASQSLSALAALVLAVSIWVPTLSDAPVSALLQDDAGIFVSPVYA